MTLNELKNDVARLGFESYIEDEDVFIASANRALSMIYADRPVSRTATLSFTGPRVNVAREFIEHRTGDVITIAFSGKSLSFKSSGSGTCTITDPSGTSKIPLSLANQLTKQFVYAEGTVTFSGDYYFTVSDFAVFEDLISERPTDIPEYKPYRELSMEDFCDGFRAFASQPCDKEGNPVHSVKPADGMVRAPFDFRGEIYLTYYRSPSPISGNDQNELIDVSDECAPMLPLLTASFMWLDDDAAKAQYYMSLYRDMIANVKRYSISKVDAQYSVNGWA